MDKILSWIKLFDPTTLNSTANLPVLESDTQTDIQSDTQTDIQSDTQTDIQ